MKEKEFFKEKYQTIMEQMVQMEDKLSKKGSEVDKEKDKFSQQLIMLEQKNEKLYEAMEET